MTAGKPAADAVEFVLNAEATVPPAMGKTTASTAEPAWNVQKMTMDFVKTADSAETVQ